MHLHYIRDIFYQQLNVVTSGVKRVKIQVFWNKRSYFGIVHWMHFTWALTHGGINVQLKRVGKMWTVQEETLTHATQNTPFISKDMETLILSIVWIQMYCWRKY